MTDHDFDTGIGEIAEYENELVYERIDERRAIAPPDSIRRHIAFITITFKGVAAQPPSRAEVEASFRTGAQNVYDFFESMSYGATFLTGEVFGPIEVEKGTVTCDKWNWSTQAKNKLAASGVDLSRFTNFVVIGPGSGSSGCSFAGVAFIGGNATYMNGNIRWTTLAHELGHNFGLRHARSATSEYGDAFDRMGNGKVGFHAQYRYRMGILEASDILEVTKSARVELGALEVPNHGLPRLLRIPRGDGSYITVETRRPRGQYDPPSTSPAVGGILVRTVASTGNTSEIIDAAASTSATDDAAFLPGQSVTDPLSKITVKCIRITSTLAEVAVTFPGDTEVPPVVDPTPTPTPAPTQTFTDVPTNQFFYRDIEELAKLGIVRGYADGSYKPKNPVTRDQMAAFLNRLRKYLESR